MKRVLIEIDTNDPRAPGCLVARIVNKKIQARFLKEVRANGFPESEETGLIQGDIQETIDELMVPRNAKTALKKYGSVRVLMDPFEAGNLWGYDGNEILARLCDVSQM